MPKTWQESRSILWPYVSRAKRHLVTNRILSSGQWVDPPVASWEDLTSIPTADVEPLAENPRWDLDGYRALVLTPTLCSLPCGLGRTPLRVLLPITPVDALYLLHLGAHPGIVARDGRTALHDAAGLPHVTAFLSKAARRHPASLAVKDHHGETPLDIAVRELRPENVNALLEAGATLLNHSRHPRMLIERVVKGMPQAGCRAKVMAQIRQLPDNRQY